MIQSIKQSSLFPKQNVNKINNVFLSIDEADISNLHIRIFYLNNALYVTRFTVSKIGWKKVQAEVNHLYTLPLYTLVVTHYLKNLFMIEECFRRFSHLHH